MAILERHDTGAIARLTMNTPEKLNALSDEMLAALQEQIDALREDSRIKVVILSGAGKAFCAGHDIKQMTAGPRGLRTAARLTSRICLPAAPALMTGLQSLPQPVIAQVHGIATAAGCQLVASCDLAGGG